MGGLWRRMPVTFWTFAVGSAALAGIPPLAGFWSKDELLVAASKGHAVVFTLMLVTALVTAFYTARMVVQTFFGAYRGHGEPHEAPAVMTGPLVALAFGTITVGFLGSVVTRGVFFNWVFFEVPEPVTFVLWVATLSILAAGLGILAGWYVYRDQPEPDPVFQLGWLSSLLINKFYLDDVYMNGIVLPIRDRLATAVVWFDRNVVDGVVNGTARLTKDLAFGTDEFDRTVVDGAVNGVAQAAGFTGGLLRYLQSGNVQRYAAFLFVGVVVLAIVITRV
jgi:NADH-quinone oxidoreductase subunit L